MFKILIGVVVIAILTIGTFLFLDPSIGISQIGGDVTEVESHTLNVSVEGEVYKPGTYTLKEGSTLLDLIDASGGTTSAADERAYYETALLQSNMTYYIASLYDPSDVCNNTLIEKVNINSDDASTIASVNGVSTTVANSIVTYRQENGLFSTLEDLMKVYGIGSATYKKIRNFVYLHA